MKKIIAFFVIALCLGNNIPSFAENKTSKLTEPETSELTPSPTRRPKLPAQIRLTCQYWSNHIKLDFPEEVNYIETTIRQEDHIIWHGILTKAVPEADIPYLKGEYTIECRTDENQIFEGTLLFI